MKTKKPELTAITKYPWYLINDQGDFRELYIESESAGWKAGPIAILRPINNNRAMARANGRVMAAAPELLDALESLVEIICGGVRDVTIEDCDEAKRVLCKAKDGPWDS